MTGGQVAALIFAILLFFPGGCFLLVGGVMSDSLAVLVGAGILVLVGLLGWVAFRRKPRPPANGGTV